jgi:hypothetical protein
MRDSAIAQRLLGFFWAEWLANGESGRAAMGLFILKIMFWSLGIRGHIPQFGDYQPNRNSPSSFAFGAVTRIVAGFVVSVACLALALWLAVWLAMTVL